MFEPKPMASLTSGLLARKGDARPAIRRAYVPMTTVAPLPSSLQREADHDDLGWNDSGSEEPPVVKQQQERIARSFASPAKRAPSKPPAAAPRPVKAKAAFTLRLDADRHLLLRLASALANRSSQHLVTEALDAFLDRQPGLDALVAEARKTTEK